MKAALVLCVLTYQLNVLAPARAEDVPYVCSWKIKTTDGKTREVKQFEPANAPFILPLEDIPGWKHCRVSEAKKFIHDGRPSTRLDIWCVTAEGAATNNSGVATAISPVVFQQFQILGSPVTFLGAGTKASINANGYVDVEVWCMP